MHPPPTVMLILTRLASLRAIVRTLNMKTNTIVALLMLACSVTAQNPYEGECDAARDACEHAGGTYSSCQLQWDGCMGIHG